MTPNRCPYGFTNCAADKCVENCQTITTHLLLRRQEATFKAFWKTAENTDGKKMTNQTCKSPLSWIGGKNALAKWIHTFVPPPPRMLR
jgi:hypothetical protein